jgi:hypothetical protein
MPAGHRTTCRLHRLARLGVEPKLAASIKTKARLFSTALTTPWYWFAKIRGPALPLARAGQRKRFGTKSVDIQQANAVMEGI